MVGLGLMVQFKLSSRYFTTHLSFVLLLAYYRYTSVSKLCAFLYDIVIASCACVCVEDCSLFMLHKHGPCPAYTALHGNTRDYETSAIES